MWDKKCKIMLCIGVLGLAVALGGAIEGSLNRLRYEKVVAEKEVLQKNLMAQTFLLIEAQDALIYRGLKAENKIKFLIALTEAYEMRNKFFQENFDPNNFSE